MIKLTTMKLNQTIVHEPHRSTFFSYDTPIVSRYNDGSIELHDAWAYSSTTSKYRAQFLHESTKETRDKLVKGTYTLRDYYA